MVEVIKVSELMHPFTDQGKHPIVIEIVTHCFSLQAQKSFGHKKKERIGFLNPSFGQAINTVKETLE